MFQHFSFDFGKNIQKKLCLNHWLFPFWIMSKRPTFSETSGKRTILKVLFSMLFFFFCFLLCFFCLFFFSTISFLSICYGRQITLLQIHSSNFTCWFAENNVIGESLNSYGIVLLHSLLTYKNNSMLQNIASLHSAFNPRKCFKQPFRKKTWRKLTWKQNLKKKHWTSCWVTIINPIPGLSPASMLFWDVMHTDFQRRW